MVRIGIIGAGGIAQQHMRSLMEVDDTQVSAVADNDLAKAEALAGTCGAVAMADYSQMLDATDAVYICTPPTLHAEQVAAVAEAGKPVFCEKPIATTLEDGRRIMEAVRRHGVPMMVGFNMRFREPFRMLKDVCASGELGEPISYWTTRMAPSTPAAGDWRVTPGLLCGITTESVSHDIDLLRWLGGETTSVTARLFNTQPKLPGYDDNLSALLELQNGATATLNVSWSAQLSGNTRGVVGTDGAAAVEGPGMWTLARVRARSSDDEGERVMPFDDDVANDMGYLAEACHFVECLRDGTPFTTTEADGLAALRVSLAMQQSSREGRTVRLEELEP